MNKADYWIINSCVEVSYPLTSLNSEDIELTFNRESHGLRFSELVETLNRLFENKLLIARSSRGDYSADVTFTPSLTEIKASLKDPKFYPDGLYYALTSKGGREWEELSKPQWFKYLDSGYIPRGENRDHIISADRDLLKRYVEMKLNCGYVLTSKIKWEIISPWKATYWKTLPLGHSVSFSCESLTGERDVHWKEELEFKEFLTEIRNWYTEPRSFELA